MKSLLFVMMVVPALAFAQKQEPVEHSQPSSQSPAPAEFLNFHFSPTELLFGGIGIGLDVKVADHVSLGLKYSSLSFRLFDSTWKGSTTTFRGDYSFKPMFVSGWYLTGQAGNSSLTLSITASDGHDYSATGSGTFIGVGGGYHWFWKHFNLNIGGLLASNPIGKLKVTDNNGTEVESDNAPITTSMIDFGLGFTF